MSPFSASPSSGRFLESAISGDGHVSIPESAAILEFTRRPSGTTHKTYTNELARDATNLTDWLTDWFGHDDVDAANMSVSTTWANITVPTTNFNTDRTTHTHGWFYFIFLMVVHMQFCVDLREMTARAKQTTNSVETRALFEGWLDFDCSSSIICTQRSGATVEGAKGGASRLQKLFGGGIGSASHGQTGDVPIPYDNNCQLLDDFPLLLTYYNFKSIIKNSMPTSYTYNKSSYICLFTTWPHFTLIFVLVSFPNS